jgi:hypothetical protein
MSHFTAYPHSPVPNAGCNGHKVFFIDRQCEELYKIEGLYYDVKFFVREYEVLYNAEQFD